nr:hypothetical protein [Tanacetum cinerariifolium]
MQTQTSNTLHNAIMEADSKDRPPISQQAATRNRGKVIVNSPQSIYDQEPSMVAEDDEMSKDKEIDKLVALISLSFKKIYKPTNNNLRTSSNTSRENQDDSLRINRSTGKGMSETKTSKGCSLSQGKMLLCKQEEAGIQLNAEQADWRDDTDDESKDQELEAHYMYMAQIQEVSPDAVDSGPIFDSEPVEQIDQNDDDNDLANERELLASLIKKLKCEIDDSKNRNKFLETSNKVLVEKLKVEIEDFKNKNISLESSNNCFKEANNNPSETNKLLYNDFKKSQAELVRRYIADSNSKEDLEEDPKEEENANYANEPEEEDPEEEDPEEEEEDEAAVTRAPSRLHGIPSPSFPVPSPPPIPSLPLPPPVPVETHAPKQDVIAALLMLPSTTRRSEVPKADMPPQKRLYFATPTTGFGVGESSAAATRPPRDP